VKASSGMISLEMSKTGMLSREVLLLCRTFRLRESDPFLERLPKLERLMERRREGTGDPGRDSQRELERSRSRSYPNVDPKEKVEDDEVREKNDVFPWFFPDMV